MKRTDEEKNKIKEFKEVTSIKLQYFINQIEQMQLLSNILNVTNGLYMPQLTIIILTLDHPKQQEILVGMRV